MIEGKTFRKGAAVLAVFNQLGGGWKILSLARFLPDGLINSGYDLVASNRYKFFGKKICSHKILINISLILYD